MSILLWKIHFLEIHIPFNFDLMKYQSNIAEGEGEGALQINHMRTVHISSEYPYTKLIPILVSRHGHVGGTLPRRQGAGQRHGHRAGGAGPGGTHRPPLRRLHVRVCWQDRPLPHSLCTRTGRRMLVTCSCTNLQQS